MRTLRLLSLCLAAAAALVVPSTALAKQSKPTAPKNLRGFLVRPSEKVVHVFSRTPAFTWAPVRGALCYEFELATSKTFTESSLVWSNVRYGVKPGGGCQAVPASSPAASDAAEASSTSSGSEPSSGSESSSGSTTGAQDPAVTSMIQPLRVPAVSVDVALPWFTGNPYALHARVRAITSRGPTGWSKRFGFNMRWPSVPRPKAAAPGLVRWTPVIGATAYQVWFPDAGKVFTTVTNVADQREFYTWKFDAGWWAGVRYRVRAIRRVFGDVPNGLQPVSYGPWSPVYSAFNPGKATGPLTLAFATSDRVSGAKATKPHQLMPAFSFRGNQSLDGRAFDLFRMYAFTDRDCVNVVYRGAVVGSPGYAPRATGPLSLPFSDEEIDKALNVYLKDANDEGDTRTIDGAKIVTNETVQSASATSGTAEGFDLVTGAKVDLPDVDFPSTRYFWTVVPVALLEDADGTRFYKDMDLPQDACRAGRVLSFGKESDPVVTGARYVSGLTPGGRLLSAAGGKKRPFVYSTPLVAWLPALGATAYEVQWSRTRYPWRAQGSKTTYSTSAVLDLAPGSWFFRVRGLNQLQARKPEMSWSAPVRLKVAKPTFRLVASR